MPASLLTPIRTFISRQFTAAEPTFSVAVYRGCQTGWRYLGAPRSAAAAARFIDVLTRINPTLHCKIVQL